MGVTIRDDRNCRRGYVKDDGSIEWVERNVEPDSLGIWVVRVCLLVVYVSYIVYTIARCM